MIIRVQLMKIPCFFYYSYAIVVSNLSSGVSASSHSTVAKFVQIFYCVSLIFSIAICPLALDIV